MLSVKPGHSLTETQSVYSAFPADWTEKIRNICKRLGVNNLIYFRSCIHPPLYWYLWIFWKLVSFKFIFYIYVQNKDLRPVLNMLSAKYIRDEFYKFPDFFKNCRRLLKIQYVIAVHLMRWLTIYDFRFKWTPTAGIGIHPTKTWLSQLVDFKNAIWTWGHLYNKIVLNLEKMPQKRMKCFRLPFEHLAWIEHQPLSGIRDSRKAGSLWGMMRGVGGVKKSIHQSWLAKGLRLGLLCWGFKGV